MREADGIRGLLDQASFDQISDLVGEGFLRGHAVSLPEGIHIHPSEHSQAEEHRLAHGILA